MSVDTSVRQAVDRHLGELDRAAPGLVEMLYLTGSVALDDFRPGVSDIDFLAVTSRPVSGTDLDAVRAFHEGLTAAPPYDGLYLDRAATAELPDDGRVVPHAVNGGFHTDQPCGELNPVLWLTVAQCGVTMRGPAPADLGLRVDPDRLRRWNLDNLVEYWRPLAGQIRLAVTGRAPDTAANPVGVAWAALGPARLHYTLATGEVISKSGAGRYAMRHFPQWTELVERTTSWRDGRDVGFVTADALAAAAMVDAIVDDACRRWG